MELFRHFQKLFLITAVTIILFKNVVNTFLGRIETIFREMRHL